MNVAQPTSTYYMYVYYTAHMNSSVHCEYHAASGDVDRRGVCRFGLETAGNCNLALYTTVTCSPSTRLVQYAERCFKAKAVIHIVYLLE
jgi:hypothetical protein